MKASHLLQSKDLALQQLSGESPVSHSHSAQQLERAKQELIEERDRLQKLVDELKEMVTQQEQQYEQAQQKSKTALSQQQGVAEAATRRAQQAELEASALRDELASLQLQVRELSNSGAAEIVQRDREIERLKKQSSNASANSEAEQRIAQMTEYLLQKQNQIEQLSGERSYMQLRIESLQAELKTQASLLSKAQSDVDEEQPTRRSARMRSIASLVATTNSPPSVLRLADLVDTLTSEIARVLRRSPLSRLIFFFYVVSFFAFRDSSRLFTIHKIFLHIWVFFVVSYFGVEAHNIALQESQAAN